MSKIKIGSFMIILFTLIFSIIFTIILRLKKDSEHNYYSRSAVVVNVDRENDTVTVKDYAGFTWVFTECDDWCLGDGCTMIIENMGTKNISDDKIINVRYERFDLLKELSGGLQKVKPR